MDNTAIMCTCSALYLLYNSKVKKIKTTGSVVFTFNLIIFFLHAKSKNSNYSEKKLIRLQWTPHPLFLQCETMTLCVINYAHPFLLTNPCLGVIKQRTNNLIAKTQARAINCVCWINYAATLRKFSVFLPVRNLHLHIRRCFCLQKRKRDDEYSQDLHYGGGGKLKNLHSEFQPITARFGHNSQPTSQTQFTATRAIARCGVF